MNEANVKNYSARDELKPLLGDLQLERQTFYHPDWDLYLHDDNYFAAIYREGECLVAGPYEGYLDIKKDLETMTDVALDESKFSKFIRGKSDWPILAFWGTSALTIIYQGFSENKIQAIDNMVYAMGEGVINSPRLEVTIAGVLASFLAVVAITGVYGLYRVGMEALVSYKRSKLLSEGSQKYVFGKSAEKWLDTMKQFEDIKADDLSLADFLKKAGMDSNRWLKAMTQYKEAFSGELDLDGFLKKSGF